MRILIATGIYPPKTSGPAQYAKNMNDFWTKMGHKVNVKTYSLEYKLPTGIRHICYFFKILPQVIKSDVVFALDTFSVGFPAVLASKIFSKKIVLRTGGDFLWETYVERTADLVLLKDFYRTRKNKLSLKEGVIFSIIKWTLNHVDILVFSTEWQKNIFLEPYKLLNKKIEIIENHYEKKMLGNSSIEIPNNKNFISGTRPLKWKNIELLKNVFKDPIIKSVGATLDNSLAPYDAFVQKMESSYAVILVSLGDISPHLILDAISLNKPFILTSENGLMNRISEVAIIVDPKDEADIKEKILWLSDENNYKNQVEKIREFSFTHTWEDIAEEFINLFKYI